MHALEVQLRLSGSELGGGWDATRSVSAGAPLSPARRLGASALCSVVGGAARPRGVRGYASGVGRRADRRATLLLESATGRRGQADGRHAWGRAELVVADPYSTISGISRNSAIFVRVLVDAAGHQRRAIVDRDPRVSRDHNVGNRVCLNSGPQLATRGRRKCRSPARTRHSRGRRTYRARCPGPRPQTANALQRAVTAAARPLQSSCARRGLLS